jgi:malonyl-CoA/methylmalonyl-CoA synthetase
MGEKRAITFLRNGREETALSFLQLDRDTDTMARAFLKMGVQEGDRGLLYLPKSLALVVAHLALQKIGAISVPLNPAFKKDEMAFFLGETTPALVLSGKDQENILKEIDPALPILSIDTDRPYESPGVPEGGPRIVLPDAEGLGTPGIIIFTSGTTGQPKGAVLTQGNLSHDARNLMESWEIDQEDTLCHALPFFHVHGLCFALHTALLAGATTVMLDAFDPDTVLRVLSRENITVFMAVPTMYARMMEHLSDKPAKFSKLRLLTSGSAPLLEKDFQRIKEVFGMAPLEREGMSETLVNFSNPLRGKRKPGSIGLPLPHLDVRVVDPDTLKDVEPGRVGEIWLKGPGVTPGYWGRPEETERAFVDGWFRTGDLGRRDDEGYYTLTDRIKNIIISGGENISPKEIETVIDRLEEVIESCVVGLPDEMWGEIAVAAVAVKPGSGLTPEEIRENCKESLLNWKCPKKVLLVSELPKNRMGKVLRDAVKELF